MDKSFFSSPNSLHPYPHAQVTVNNNAPAMPDHPFMDDGHEMDTNDHDEESRDDEAISVVASRRPYGAPLTDNAFEPMDESGGSAGGRSAYSHRLSESGHSPNNNDGPSGSTSSDSGSDSGYYGSATSSNNRLPSQHHLTHHLYDHQKDDNYNGHSSNTRNSQYFPYQRHYLHSETSVSSRPSDFTANVHCNSLPFQQLPSLQHHQLQRQPAAPFSLSMRNEHNVLWSNLDSSNADRSCNCASSDPVGNWASRSRNNYIYHSSNPTNRWAERPIVHPKGALRANFSRHVSAVLTHFTTTNEGYSRLLSEIDDYLHVINPDGVLIYNSPSVIKLLGRQSSSLDNSALEGLVHPDDYRALSERVVDSCNNDRPFAMYVRYKTAAGSYVLVEIFARPYNGVESTPPDMTHRKRQRRTTSMADATTNVVDSLALQAHNLVDWPTHREKVAYGSTHRGSRSTKVVIAVAREYKTKGTESVDAVLEFRIQNLQLRQLLTDCLVKNNVDPKTHPLLLQMSKNMSPEHLATAELSSAIDSFNDHILSNDNQMFVEDDSGFDTLMDSMADEDWDFDKIPLTMDVTQPVSTTADGAATSSSFNNGGSEGIVRSQNDDTGERESEQQQDGETAMQPKVNEPVGQPVKPNLGGCRHFSKRKRKQKYRKGHDDLNCRQCGATSSPEWRKGPKGPKTLCNACGLAYSKKRKVIMSMEQKSLEKPEAEANQRLAAAQSSSPVAANTTSVSVPMNAAIHVDDIPSSDRRDNRRPSTSPINEGFVLHPASSLYTQTPPGISVLVEQSGNAVVQKQATGLPMTLPTSLTTPLAGDQPTSIRALSSMSLVHPTDRLSLSVAGITWMISHRLSRPSTPADVISPMVAAAQQAPLQNPYMLNAATSSRIGSAKFHSVATRPSPLPDLTSTSIVANFNYNVNGSSNSMMDTRRFENSFLLPGMNTINLLSGGSDFNSFSPVPMSPTQMSTLVPGIPLPPTRSTLASMIPNSNVMMGVNSFSGVMRGLTSHAAGPAYNQQPPNLPLTIQQRILGQGQVHPETTASMPYAPHQSRLNGYTPYNQY
ncbi:hypothetical protein SeLEV6574_g02126 [Synchytrium endobioticum]|nr:hypothetical protein SeLEV6574_g02126 [Synchytrium endobioticum]